LLQKKAVPVVILAIPGVVLSTVLVAIAVRPFLGDFGWLPALLFGAMLAPTDPISVIATLKNAKAPHRLRTLIEGESLFNDGTGIVLFLILVAAVFTVDGKTTDLSFVNGIMQFVKVAGLGVVFGLGFGLSAFWILRRLNDHVLENAITIVLAWGSFIVAEQSGASGVIAVVVAGLIIGNYGTKLAMSDQTVQTINTFWESIDFLINSIVFLLIGFELQDIGGLSELLQVSVVSAVASVFIAILVARGVLVYPIAFILGRHWNKGWKHVVFWSGLKGSIPLALVLGLPDGELKNMLVPIAFGVVLVSLLLQGLTVGPLIRYLGVAGDDH
jgi:CPA1 family monovalent cation:H+ antiporter